jgi:hypothetical protein
MPGTLAPRRLSRVLGVAIVAGILASCWTCGGGGGGDRIQPTQHSVSLSWTASVSSVVGYNVYRGTQPSGPYPLKVNSSPHTGTSFTDSTVQSGTTYYYVVTAVDANSVESDYSNEGTAVIPYP